jgi:7-cyano-7-deazaguanine tRNA-ribosyltransferase
MAHTPADLRAAEEAERHRLLAEHNLAVSFGEIRRVRQAIRGGNLLELVDARARGHPAMLDGYRTLLHYADQLRRTDPVAKDAFFYVSGESARRPEVRRHHERLGRLDAPEQLRLTVGSPGDDGWRLIPPFGPVPPALSDVYPLTAQRPDGLERPAYEAAVRGVARLVAANPETAITVVHDGWPDDVLAGLPDGVVVDVLGGS